MGHGAWGMGHRELGMGHGELGEAKRRDRELGISAASFFSVVDRVPSIGLIPLD
jgi:hypothetical protein